MSDVAMNETPTNDTADNAERLSRQRRRSIAIAAALGFMAVMFFAVTIIQLKEKVASDRFKPIKEQKMKVIPNDQVPGAKTGAQPGSTQPKAGGQ